METFSPEMKRHLETVAIALENVRAATALASMSVEALLRAGAQEEGAACRHLHTEQFSGMGEEPATRRCLECNAIINAKTGAVIPPEEESGG
jgi:hypothetical protein